MFGIGFLIKAGQLLLALFILAVIIIAFTTMFTWTIIIVGRMVGFNMEALHSWIVGVFQQNNKEE